MPSIEGTWKLISGVSINNKGVSTFTDYTQNQSMIKIFNKTHFAFLKHFINTAKDSTNHFDAGGGSYTLVGNKYTEHLDYYSDKSWENRAFDFTVSFKGDTLIQRGIEKNDKEENEIIEKYLKVK